MTPDNRSLWELVENWRARYAKELKKTTRHPFDAVEYKICANELAEILERPVVVGEKQVGDICEKAAKSYLADTYKFKEFSQENQHMCRHFVRAALESMVRGKS